MEPKFGLNFETSWPTMLPVLTNFGEKMLKKCCDLKAPNSLNLKTIIENSSKFPIKFPITSCKICNQPKERRQLIEQQAASAYPVVHERVIWLLLRFLEHKVNYGSKIEQQFYANMDLPEFVQRLLDKRCVSFLDSSDSYLLLDGKSGCGGFEKIGTQEETAPLLLKNCLSYDEIKLSAFLSVSSHSEFLNNGNRMNLGVVEKNKNCFEIAGVIIGLIGARLERANVMEYQELVITEEQNISKNGYGIENLNPSSSEDCRKFDYRQMWNEFYEETGVIFANDLKDGNRFGDCMIKGAIFDNLIMKKRYTISFDTLLLESEARAAVSGKKAYIHVVGFGLGVWKVAVQQEEIFLQTFAQRLRVLLPKLNHISFVHFSWFSLTECGDIRNENVIKGIEHPDGGIKIFLSKRNPADKLEGHEFSNTLLIVSYAWDGNALPGNEFWIGALTATGDPAAACSTLISELHNPYINESNVSGNNLHVATEKYGLIHVGEFAKNMLQDKNN